MSKFSLYYPVKPFSVIQGFGVNGQYYRDHGINILGHDGLDLLTFHGQPVYATHDGQAYFEIDNLGGHGVVIRTTDQYDYNGQPAYMKSIYWHLCDGAKELQFDSPIKATDILKDGQPVKAGDIIGYADNTGLSTGTHLHFAIKPMAMTGEYPGQFANYAQTNGYLGNIDPTLYFNGLYAQDINNKVAPFNTNLNLLMKSPEVARLQGALRQLGYFRYPENTGFYGAITSMAVLEFQYHNNVVSSGLESGMGAFFGPKSRAKLNELVC